jgi:hypothetical protein
MTKRELLAVEHDAMDDLPEAPDPLGSALAHLCSCIFELMPTDTPERRAALTAMISCGSRLRELINPQRRLN